jgi:hypothetical protein
MPTMYFAFALNAMPIKKFLPHYFGIYSGKPSMTFENTSAEKTALKEVGIEF